MANNFIKYNIWCRTRVEKSMLLYQILFDSLFSHISMDTLPYFKNFIDDIM